MKTKADGFSRVSYTEKTFSFPKGAFKKDSRGGFTAACALPADKTVIKHYSARGEILFYCSDGKMYAFTGGECVAATDKVFSSPPDVIAITSDGREKLLFVTPDGSVTEGSDETERGVPHGDCYALVNGMLFSAKGRVIRFSAPFDFTEFSTDLNLGGYFETDYESGDVLFMCERQGKLVAVCRHAILSLGITGERTDYTARKINDGYLDVLAGSAVKIGENVYFISDGKLVESGAATAFYDLPDSADLSRTGIARTRGGFYLLPLSDGEKLLCFKSGGERGAFVTDGKGYVSEDGFAIDVSAGELCFFDCAAANGVSRAKSNLGVAGVKRIKRVYVYGGVGATVSVSGNGCERVYAPEKPCESFGCDLFADVLSVAVKGGADDVEITVKYTVTGV